MFIEVTTTKNDDILLNTDVVSIFERQADNTTKIYGRVDLQVKQSLDELKSKLNVSQINLDNDFIEKLKSLLKEKEEHENNCIEIGKVLLSDLFKNKENKVENFLDYDYYVCKEDFSIIIEDHFGNLVLYNNCHELIKDLNCFKNLDEYLTSEKEYSFKWNCREKWSRLELDEDKYKKSNISFRQYVYQILNSDLDFKGNNEDINVFCGFPLCKNCSHYNIPLSGLCSCMIGKIQDKNKYGKCDCFIDRKEKIK